MIIDTSALIAIIAGEPERGVFLDAVVHASQPRMSAASLLEASVIVDRRRDPILSRRFDDFIDSAGIEVVDVTRTQVDIARGAFRDFGKGSGHPAQLNFDDCFSYALARQSGEALLFKGDDFAHTDVTTAS
jgi:ribonuclease VapC